MKYISVIPLDSAVRVTTKGFKYPLCNELLSRDSSRGISNEIIEDIGLIEVVDGCALVAETVD